jgi:hypothetical protein
MNKSKFEIYILNFYIVIDLFTTNCKYYKRNKRIFFRKNNVIPFKLFKTCQNYKQILAAASNPEIPRALYKKVNRQ